MPCRRRSWPLEAWIEATAQETLTKDVTNLAPLVDRLIAGAPNALWVMPDSSTTAFFKAYEASGWNVPMTVEEALAAGQQLCGDNHNHLRTTWFIVGLQEGKPSVIGPEWRRGADLGLAGRNTISHVRRYLDTSRRKAILRLGS
jgi:hypothetical protein